MNEIVKAGPLYIGVAPEVFKIVDDKLVILGTKEGDVFRISKPKKLEDAEAYKKLLDCNFQANPKDQESRM